MSQLLQDLVNIVLLGEFLIKVYKFWKNHRGKWPPPLWGDISERRIMSFREILQIVAEICAVAILCEWIYKFFKWTKRK